MLKLRILTALILIPLVIAGIFYTSQFYFKLITASILLLAAWEWSGLSAYRDFPKRILYVGVQAVILFLISPYLIYNGWLKLGLIFWSMLSVYLIWARNKSKLPNVNPIVSTVLGWIILTLCWVA